MNSVTARWLPLIAAVLLTLSSTSALAQVVTTAAMSGAVSDQNGEPLPGATVVAVHQPSGTQFGAVTRADGRFNISNARVGGPYAVTASFLGYQSQEQADVTLALGQDLELTFTLTDEAVEVAGIEVVADANRVINPDRTGAETNIDREQIEQLPTISRSISDYTRLNPQSSGFNSFGGKNNLYNNISVDGSVLNNVFGLASEVGGQTRSQPISPEAVEQIQVAVAPYDVREGNFTGAGINVVTRAGTNEYGGAVYTYYRNEAFVNDNLDGSDAPIADFTEQQTGFSLGGPILPNRAFFFVNGELRRRTDPGAAFRPSVGGETGPDVATVDQGTLEAIQQALQSRYGYDPGTFGAYDLGNGSDNLTMRFDANLNPAHRASLRFNYLNSNRDVPLSNSGATGGGRQNGATRIPFSGSNYTINNDVYSVIGQLNSTFGPRYANQFTIGYTALRDARGAFSEPFPLVDIEDGSGRTITSFGYEPFTANNLLDTDIFQVSSNLSGFFGRHTVTVGTSNEFYSFSNGFTPNFYGQFRFRSAEDFLAHINAEDPTAAGVPQPTRYQLQYSAVEGVPVPFAEVSAAQLALYAQDEVRLLDNLRLTLGLRMDVPVFTSDLPANPAVAGLTFRDLDGEPETIDVSELPAATPLFSPRLGFNYDVLNDRRFQVRGGTGVFTGRVPFVWVSNQASNNGVLFGETVVTGNGTAPLCQPGTGGSTGNDCQPIVFSDDVTAYVPANPTTPASVTINATDSDFRFPQVFRSNLGFDAALPYGFTATVEGIYSKDLNAVFHRNANLEPAVGTFGGADDRPRFARSTNDLRINDNVTSAIVLDNTSQGYQYSFTGELQKTFDAGTFAGLFGRLAYTLGRSRDLTSSTSSIAGTSYNNNQIVENPNDPVLGFSTYEQRSRVLGVVAYNFEYLGSAGTTLSFVYTGQYGTDYAFRSNNATNFSYAYAGDMNGDGITGNDLLYVPRDQSEIDLRPASGDTRTPDEIWQQLDAFIEQDPYLSERRGLYAERGGLRAPWTNRLDLSLKQQFFVPVGGGRRTRLELSADVVNVGNLLNSEWGVVRTPVTTQPIAYSGYDPDANRPYFTFPLQGGAPLAESFRTEADVSSRWQALLGVKLSL